MAKGLHLYFTMEELRNLSVALSMYDSDAKVHRDHIVRNGFPTDVVASVSERYDFVHSVFKSFQESCDTAVRMEAEKRFGKVT